MSETLFGFALVLALWLLCLGERTARPSIMAAAGSVFGIAYLVNPTILFFPPLAGFAVALRKQWHLAAVLLLCFSVVPIAWSWRNAQLAGEYSAFRRAAENFVEGSSPLYMQAFNSRWVNADAKRIVDTGTSETALLLADPQAGFAVIAARMCEQPGEYLVWYALRKPILLWDWSILVGTGDIYYPVSLHSPFERIVVLKALRQLLQWLNPAIFPLALVSAFWFSARALARRVATDFAPTAIALCPVYVTAIQVVFQSEPRYSIPYRPEEILLAMTTLAWGLRAAADRYRRRAVVDGSSAGAAPGQNGRPA